ncbi:hypothetical protein FOZ62_003374 [Perkinsus olseni]|uniref:Uncharacterized protein n=1 Tax=Perkinsus olseni TaxID=32597 RepID=A0A7J6T549_PEROL|nr:hypothetical protein FOZ62_003374 [Perkinsus olseni]
MEVAVGCNGVAYVGSTGEGREPPRLPRLSSGSGIIAPYWVESSKARCPDTSGCRISFVVRETNTTSTLVVEWRNLLVEANTTAGSVVMQLHVHTDGRLVFLYKTIPDNAHRRDLAVGIGSADGYEGRNIMRDLNGTGPLAVVWTPRLSSSPVMLPANSTTVVEFELSTPFLGLPGGDAVCEETGWVDAFNRTCADYVAKALCTEDGTPGIGWDSSLGGFAQAAFNTPADVSCCGCGGGTWTRDPSEGAPWQDTLVLGLKDVDDERGSFSRTITGSAELDVLLDGDEELIPYEGGLRTLRVIAQDPSRSVNVKESGLTVTIDLFVSGILHSSKNVVLVGGQGTAEFDIPSGPTTQIVTCGGDDVVGANGLRYLLWSGLTGKLVCALLNHDGDGWLAANGSSLSPTPEQGWYSIAMADSSGRIVAAVDASPRRVGEVLLGFESSIAFGGCGGFCVSAGTIDVDFGAALRESLIRVLREKGSETTEDEDGRGGTVITTTTPTDRSGDIFTTTPIGRSADIFTTTPTGRSADIFTTTPTDRSGDLFTTTSTDRSGDIFTTTSTDQSGDLFTTTSTDQSGDLFTTTSTDRSGDLFTIAVSTTPNPTMSVPAYLDCDAGCWADHPGSYCKYWLTPSVCYVSGKPCRCAHLQGR